MMHSSLAKFQQSSALSDDEIYFKKRLAWNETPENKQFVLNSAQLLKLSNKEFEVITTIGNRLYGDKKR